MSLSQQLPADWLFDMKPDENRDQSTDSTLFSQATLI